MIKDKDIAIQIQKDFDYIYRVYPNYVSSVLMHWMDSEYILYVFVEENTLNNYGYPNPFLGMSVVVTEPPKAL